MWRRYACVRQETAADCGAACLATICRSFRHKISVSAMRLYAGTDRYGTNVFGIMEAARTIGFTPQAVRCDKSALGSVALPAIAHVMREGLPHFVVVHRLDDDAVIVADPAEGLLRRKRSEFEAAWSGVLVLFPGEPSFKSEQASTPVWRRLADLVQPNDYLLAEGFIASLLMTLLGFGFALYLQYILDNALGTHNAGLLGAATLVLGGVVLCRAMFALMRGALMAWLARKIDATLLSGWCRHVVRLPMAFFNTCRAGDLVSRLHDAVKVRELVGGSVLSFLMDSATVAAGFGILSFFSWKLALLSCCVAPPMCVVVLAVNRPLKRAQRDAMQSMAAVQSNLVENIAGASTVKMLGAEDLAVARAETAVNDLLKGLFRANSISAVSTAAAECIVGAGMATILWFAAGMAMHNHLSTGKLVSFYTILFVTLQPLLRSVLINSIVQDGLVAADRLGEVMDIPREQASEPGLDLPSDFSGEIAFHNVSFRYGCRSRTLNDVNLRIPACSTIGIVGESGSGKSTLARLLLRQFDPECGAIEIDGLDLRNIDMRRLRREVGLVEQDPFLFTGTLAENLTFGMDRVAPEAVLAAIRGVGLESWVASLPDGFSAQIGERGASLSGGQKQRIAIARMLLRDPRILILDEATSSLDARTEEIVQSTLAALRGRKTIILIAHRLSTVCRADSIIVFHQGRVVEQGPHAELLERRGRYFELWQSQMHRHGAAFLEKAQVA